MRIRNKKFVLLILLGVLAIVIYGTAPQNYSLSYTILCTVIYALSSILMLSNNCSYTLIKFEFLFVIAFFFTNFAYAIAFYPVNPYFSLFSLEFNESYICKALALSTVGATWFNVGVYERPVIDIPSRFFESVRLKLPKIVPIILFVIFLPSLYSIYQSSTYSTEFESSYVNIILRYIIFYSIFAFCYQYKDKRRSLITKAFTSPVILLTIVYAGLFLLIGSRGIPMRIALFSLFTLNLYIYRFSKLQISTIIVIGAIVLTFVGIAREGTSVAGGSISSIWDLGSDLTINNRSLYVLMEYAENSGYTYGASMLINILSVIPFAQSIFLNVTHCSLTSISSGYLVTDLYFKENLSDDIIGLGTNLVGDIYLSFGAIGVVVLFYILGSCLRKLYLRMSQGSIQSALVYALIFMNVIIYPRSGYLTPIRDVVWTLFIYWFMIGKIKLYKK